MSLYIHETLCANLVTQFHKQCEEIGSGGNYSYQDPILQIGAGIWIHTVFTKQLYFV
jgi:hypothetical protein